ncbi:MAG: hypothetical protein JSS11_08480 [Verrucomicrobia bacterium]|nr:hypothetical protein [Verrucomicrobiota bacterium]
MSTHPTAVLTPADRKALVAAHPRIASAARWFWWIAGLSVVNCVLTHSGSDTSFLIGLGFTLIADNVFKDYQAVAYAIDLLSIGFFVGMGLIALRGYRWAFILGLVFYILDGLIYLFFQDWLPVAFHVYASVMIIVGIKALNDAIKAVLSAPPIPAAVPPALEEPKQP